MNESAFRYFIISGLQLFVPVHHHFIFSQYLVFSYLCLFLCRETRINMISGLQNLWFMAGIINSRKYFGNDKHAICIAFAQHLLHYRYLFASSWAHANLYLVFRHNWRYAHPPIFNKKKSSQNHGPDADRPS